MSDIRTPPPGDKPLPGTVEVEHHAPGLALVSVHGEHDLCTTPELTQALEQAAMHSNVLVDLSDCSFIDSSVIQALVKTALALEARGEQLALVIPPEQSDGGACGTDDPSLRDPPGLRVSRRRARQVAT